MKSVYFGRANVHAGSSLLNICSILQSHRSKFPNISEAVSRRKPESQKKEMTMATYMVVAIADGTDRLKLYPEYI